MRIDKRAIDINGLTTTYLVNKYNHKFQNILLLHSYPSYSGSLVSHIELLSEQYNIYAPDLPGFGQTDKPSQYTLANYEQWLSEYMNQVGLEDSKTQVWAISFGGIVAMYHNIHTPFRKLIVESTPLSPNCIKTDEFKWLKALSVIPRRMLKDLLKRKDVKRYVLYLYKKIIPKSKIEFSDDILSGSYDSVNIDTVFAIASLLREPELYNHIPVAIKDKNTIFVYDQSDPTVQFADINEVLSTCESPTTVTVDVGCHAPSLAELETVWQKVKPLY